MRIRSPGELSDRLDQEVSWRRRELTTTRFLIRGSRDHERECLLRAGICILYAHWEGFVKAAATAYLSYVATRGLRYRDLCPSLVALGLRPRLLEAERSSRVTVHTGIAEFLLSDMMERSDVPYEAAVDTMANLTSEVFQEVLCLVNLDYSSYATKKAIIDDKLLFYRNKVAHGDRLPVALDDYETLHEAVLSLISLFRNDIENAASTERFLLGSMASRHPVSAPP